MRHLLPLAAFLCVGCATAAKEAPTAAQMADPDKDSLVAVIEQAQKEGFALVNENGEELYCKKDSKTGSRVKAQLTCFTPEQLLEKHQTMQRDIENMRRTGFVERGGG
jgi:hypothetical protein